MTGILRKKYGSDHLDIVTENGTPLKTLVEQNMVEAFEKMDMLEKGFLLGCLSKVNAHVEIGMLPFVNKRAVLMALMAHEGNVPKEQLIWGIIEKMGLK